MAVGNVAGLTRSPDMIKYFASNDGRAVKELMIMRKDNPLIAHDSIAALVNLSGHDELLPFMDDESFLFSVALTIVIPNSVLADLCCMLLNNMTKHASIAKRLVPPDTPPPNDAKDRPKPKTPLIDNLLQSFVENAGPPPTSTATSSTGTKRSAAPAKAPPGPPVSTRHFLAGVLANVSALAAGARCLRSRSRVDGVVRLAKVLPFTQHPDAIRRGGAIATIKNCCFDVDGEDDDTPGRQGQRRRQREEEEGDFDVGLLLSDELNLLPYLLLPLCSGDAGDEFSDDDLDGMPPELQFLEPGHRREPDPRLRLILVEALLLLAHSRPGREHLRRRKAYPVVRGLHTAEPDADVRDRVERLVNLLARDEEGEAGGPAAAAVSTEEEEGEEGEDAIEELI
ncbi:hypothetical protein HK405_006679 [Cladochytrium tenue]|nr:hypothetical protein HK405_006679 [Cladochytrium tenue]